MIVKCPRCSARYKIDAQTIPDEGMYAKCAKCENVFFARKRSDEEVARLREKRRKGPELHTPTATPEPTRKESRVTAPEPVPAESGVAPQSARETDYQSTGLEETEREVSPNAPEMEAISASEEPVSPLSQDAIEALMSASTPKPEPAKPEPAGPLGQDDIAAILAANAPKPEPVKETPSSGVMSQDDIEALLSANAPKPEPAGPLGQDDIAAILAANAPKPEPVKETPSSGVMSQDDIEALLSANAPKPEPAGPLGQDDIAAILAANAPKPEPIKEEPSSGMMSQDDIEALLSANAPKQEPAPAPAKEEPAGAMSQDDIESLLSANKPLDIDLDKTPVAVSPTRGVQDDIDALLADNAPGHLEKASGAKAATSQQDEIDALLMSALGKPAPEPTAPPPGKEKKEGQIISQDDLDALLAKPVAAVAEEKKKPDELVSQDDLDALLSGMGASTVEPAATEAAPAEEGLISQDTLDAILMEAQHGDIEKAAESIAPAFQGEHDDDLEKLLAGGEDSLGEALFDGGAKAVSQAEQSLDEMLSSDETLMAVAPDPGFHEPGDETTISAPRPFAMGAAHLPEEEHEEHEETARKAFKLPSFVTAIPGKIKEAMGWLKGKIPAIPKISLPFIKTALAKLPPKMAGVVAGLAGAMVLGALGGGYWFFFGGSEPESAQVAQLEKGSTPEGGELGKEGANAPAAPVVAPVSVDAGSGPMVKFSVYLPVEFDMEASRVMNMDVELIFDSETMAGIVRQRLFFTSTTVEKFIDTFFEDKFYEETVFVQDKLEEYLAQNLKTVEQFAGLKDVRLTNFNLN